MRLSLVLFVVFCLGIFSPQGQPSFALAMTRNNAELPNCVGMTGEEAKKAIEEAVPEARGNVYVVGENDILSMDLQFDRVRIFVDSDGIVQMQPFFG